MKKIHLLTLTLLLALPLVVNADEHKPMQPRAMSHEGMAPGSMNMDAAPMNMKKNGMKGAGNMAASGMSQGVIRKVDKASKKITIKHGPLANLNMPSMTMMFKVKDPAMLEQVKPGDKVNFVAKRIKGVLTITKIETAK